MGLFKPNWAKMDEKKAIQKLENTTKQDWLVDAVRDAPSRKIKYEAARRIEGVDMFLRAAEGCEDFRLKCLCMALKKEKNTPALIEALTNTLINDRRHTELYSSYNRSWDVDYKEIEYVREKLPEQNLIQIALNAQNSLIYQLVMMFVKLQMKLYVLYTVISLINLIIVNALVVDMQKGLGHIVA